MERNSKGLFWQRGRETVVFQTQAIKELKHDEAERRRSSARCKAVNQNQHPSQIPFNLKLIDQATPPSTFPTRPYPTLPYPILSCPTHLPSFLFTPPPTYHIFYFTKKKKHSTNSSNQTPQHLKSIISPPPPFPRTQPVPSCRASQTPPTSLTRTHNQGFTIT